jgi:hypothetical protein
MPVICEADLVRLDSGEWMDPDTGSILKIELLVCRIGDEFRLCKRRLRGAAFSQLFISTV